MAKKDAPVAIYAATWLSSTQHLAKSHRPEDDAVEGKRFSNRVRTRCGKTLRNAKVSDTEFPSIHGYTPCRACKAAFHVAQDKAAA